MIKKFKKFNEELEIKKLDDLTLNTLKSNLHHRLSEYKEYMLDNVDYNENLDKIEYKNLNRIDKNIILRELYNEFTPEFMQSLNIESFLRKINNIMKAKKRNTKELIAEEFDQYLDEIEKRILKIKNNI